MEKMLVTQALDERDLLVKKIAGKIKGAEFITTVRNNEEKVQNGKATRQEFEQRAKAQFQQIEDLIARYQRLDAAIIYSNVTTLIEVDGKPYSVAAAIAFRARLKGKGDVQTDFELLLATQMEEAYNNAVQAAELQNQKLQSTAETMRNSILGKDSKVKEDALLAVVDVYVRENTCELVDPLKVKQKMESLVEKRDSLLRELDTAIKVANATTMIEF